jgi:hypothetical protein
LKGKSWKIYRKGKAFVGAKYGFAAYFLSNQSIPELYDGNRKPGNLKPLQSVVKAMVLCIVCPCVSLQHSETNPLNPYKPL